MGKFLGAIVCLLIVILDVAAGVLGIEAEMNQNKGRHMRLFVFECRQPVYEAYRLGLAAAILLAVAHVMANLLGGCTCICSRNEYARSHTTRQMAAATLIISWLILAVGLTMLIVGALANSKSRTTCGFAHRRFLFIGGILCFVHAVFCTAYYVSARAAISDAHKMNRPAYGVYQS